MEQHSTLSLVFLCIPLNADTPCQWYTVHTVSITPVLSCLSELKALCELLGPYGIRYLGDKCMHQVMGQVLELKVGEKRACNIVLSMITTAFSFHHVPYFLLFLMFCNANRLSCRAFTVRNSTT